MSIDTVTRYQGNSLSGMTLSQNLIYQHAQLGIFFFSPLLCACWCNISLNICSRKPSKSYIKPDKIHLRVGTRRTYMKGRRAQHPVAVQAQKGKSEDWINQTCLQLFSRMGQTSNLHSWLLEEDKQQNHLQVCGPDLIFSVLTWGSTNQCYICSDTRQQCLSLCFIGLVT